MYQQGGVKVDRLISEQAIVDVLRKGYWDKNLQSAKDDPCVIDAMIDWAIRQIKAIPSAEPYKALKTLEKIEAFCRISPSMIYPDEVLDIIDGEYVKREEVNE